MAGWLIIIWIIFGVVTNIVAGYKGRGGCSWFLIGFLLGPIGLALIALTPANVAEVETRAVSSGGMKKCPYCAEVIKAEAIKCKHCGSEVPAVQPPAPLAQEVRHFTQTCKKCGEVFDYDLRKCPHCT